MIIWEALGYYDIVGKKYFWLQSLISYPGLNAIDLFAGITAGVPASCVRYP